MAIVCDTDFSRRTQQTVRTAASLAERFGETLHLVHVVDELGAELGLRRVRLAQIAPRGERI